jgi:hypothetical protein
LKLKNIVKSKKKKNFLEFKIFWNSEIEKIEFASKMTGFLKRRKTKRDI